MKSRMNAGIALVMVLSIGVILTACGPKQVKNEPPYVQVSSWRMDGTLLSADLRIRNVNDVALPVGRLDLRIMLGDTELITYSAAQDFEVAANGFESLGLELDASEAGTRKLEQLQNGDIKSLPYFMTGAVHTTAGKKLNFDREGHIYTVPGKPGQFR